MNSGEFALFCKLEQWVRQTPGAYRVFPQVCLGEILDITHRKAYWAINAKRCDFIIIDKTGLARIAIEFQGSGHNRNFAKQRDEVKKTALESAGIGYVEVFAEWTWQDVKDELKKCI